MIYFFTGKPGNGKSLHMAEIIYNSIKRGINVISNIDINTHAFDSVRHKERLGKFIYVSNDEWLNNAYKSQTGTTPKFSYIDGLYSFALNFHKTNSRGQIKEGQTILVIDECQDLFNTRTWNRSDRLQWCAFFRIHRHYGYNCYLISQDDGVVDKHIRAVLQREIEHRCINNYKFFGRILGLLCSGKLFIAIERDYSLSGKKNSRMSSQYFIGKKKFYEFYDSYSLPYRTE